MIRNLLSIVIAGSSIALLAGCSSGGGAAPAAPKDLSVTQLGGSDARALAAPAPNQPIVSANNQRDLTAAQPDSVLNATRDMDLGGNPQAGPLTFAALGDQLKQLGLAPSVENDVYVMKVKATTQDGNEWTFPIAVSLSQDQSVIWITCKLAAVTANVDMLASFLAANAQLGTAFFSIDDQKVLILEEPLNNLGVTPQVLGANLKAFFDRLKRSEPLYKALSIPPSNGAGGGGGGNPFQ
jgi:hypothetical protein